MPAADLLAKVLRDEQRAGHVLVDQGRYLLERQAFRPDVVRALALLASVSSG
jgi:hypothetical protein